MKIHELEQLAAGGENAQVEFKQTTGLRSNAMKTVCAMLNGQGGFVLFGVTPNGEIKGQEVSERTLEDIAIEIRKIDPPAFPDIETIPLGDGHQAILIRVPGGGGPYTYDGRPFARLGPTTFLMPRKQYERLLQERMHSVTRWENQPAQGITIEDLDQAEIVRTINEAIRRGRMNDPGTREPIDLLQGLKLYENGNLLNGAVALFAKPDRLMLRYPQCLLRMARFRGRSKTDDFEDNRQESGNIFELYQRGQRFMRDHLPIAGRIIPSLFERQDDPLYPPSALREALANALCHRDYGIGGGAVSIAIYDDRLEIASTGLLPFGLTVQDLNRPHPSRPWNPLIAQTLHRRGMIEGWGRGTLDMAELMEQAGLIRPEFEEIGGELIVRFRPNQYIPPSRIGHDLSPLQREILAVLAEIGPSPLSKITTHLQSPPANRTVQWNLQILKELGLVDSSGRGRYFLWMLKGTRP